MRNQILTSLGLLLYHSDPSNVPGATGEPQNQNRGGGRPEKTVSQIVASLISRHGSAETALAVLAGENRDLRGQRRQLRDALEAADAVKKNGGVVLSKEEAAAYEAYKALGKPEEVKAAVEQFPTLQQKVAETERRELLTAAAKSVAPGVAWNPDAFQELVGAKRLHVEMRDVVEADSKGVQTTVKRPHVRSADNASDPLVPVALWVQQNAAVWTPSLLAGTGTAAPQRPAVGLPVPGVQVPTGTPQQNATNPIAAAIAANVAAASRGNALNPAPAQQKQGV